MRKEKNTIKVKRKKNQKKGNKMKKIFMLMLLLSFTACGAISDKAGKLIPNVGECPPEAERSLSDIICKEPK